MPDKKGFPNSPRKWILISKGLHTFQIFDSCEEAEWAASKECGICEVEEVGRNYFVTVRKFSPCDDPHEQGSESDAGD